jgi:glycerophosphoryl diester phosphodiesterase
MFELIKRPMIFAHRGACAHAPENTISSFELAVQHRADAVELDAKLSKDGHIVVIHDQTVNRTTGGKGKVNELTLQELKTLDAGSFFGEQYSGVKIPTLDEVFEHVGKLIYINVELTNYGSTHDELVEKTVLAVKHHQMENRVLFSSFAPANLVKAHVLLPSVSVALLCLKGILGSYSRSRFSRKVSPKIIHPFLSDVDNDFVKREHQSGRRVHVWTVNNPDDLNHMFQIEVDGVFTDDPLKARQILEHK